MLHSVPPLPFLETMNQTNTVVARSAFTSESFQNLPLTAPPLEARNAVRSGHLLLIGGGFKPLEVLRHFVTLAGGGEKPVVVFPLASEKSRPTGEELKAQLLAAGAKDVRVVHIDGRRDALKPEVLEAVRQAGGLFFGGGDQNRISQRLVDTPLMEAIRELMGRGGVVAGTSAGAACQSDVMFVGEGDETVLRASNIVTTRGIGLLPGTIVDSHFVARKRQGRLESLVLEHPELLGMGIDEGELSSITHPLRCPFCRTSENRTLAPAGGVT